MAKRHFSEGGASKKSDRRAMIHEDMNKHANLPTEVMQKNYPSSGYSGGETKPDLFMGVQEQLHADHNAFQRYSKPTKV